MDRIEISKQSGSPAVQGEQEGVQEESEGVCQGVVGQLDRSNLTDRKALNNDVSDPAWNVEVEHINNPTVKENHSSLFFNFYYDFLMQWVRYMTLPLQILCRVPLNEPISIYSFVIKYEKLWIIFFQ